MAVPVPVAAIAACVRYWVLKPADAAAVAPNAPYSIHLGCVLKSADAALDAAMRESATPCPSKVAVAVASMWKKLGVQVSLVNQEWKTYLETKKQGNFDVGRAGWIADYNEASSMLDLMQTTHGNNDGKYSNPAFDKLMSESRNQVDAEARNKLYVQAEEILAKDMPIAPIYQYVTSRMVKPYVGGYPANPLDNIYSKDMYIVAH